MGWLKEFLNNLFGIPTESTRYKNYSGQYTAYGARAEELQRALTYSIRNHELFIQALLHRSFLQRTEAASSSNERLEFLGDSILNLIIGEYLYNTYPEAEEGELTKVRSRLVNKTALSAYGRAVRLDSFILMSPSAARSVGKGMETIVADTFEAIVAAIYLDGGFAAARKFVESQLQAAVDTGTIRTDDRNYKSMLLELAQSKGLSVPRYSIVHQEGPDHDTTFTVEVTVKSGTKGRGIGKNKKEAEQIAAYKALELLKSTDTVRE